jgi:HAD superfamily hydrolase (TIGR01509 family)
MKAILFDLDGVIVDSMPSHYQAWKIAFKEVSKIDVDERTIYLLEGMCGTDLIKKVFELKSYLNDNHNEQIVEQVSQRKNEVFRDILLSSPPRAYEGVKNLIMNLANCKSAVVSGSARKDVETLLEKSLGKGNLFDVLITADESTKGKPDPSSFMNALDKIKIPPSETVVVENAPLGVEAATSAGIQCIVILNNTPLNIQDFTSVIAEDRIFKEIISATTFIEGWCKGNVK